MQLKKVNCFEGTRFYVFSRSSRRLSAGYCIFIMTSYFLQSKNNLFLKCYFLIVTSSLVTFVYDVILDEKHVLSCVCMLSCICSCLLSSCMNVFSFCTFFAMNAFQFLLFFSSELFQRCHISFTATSFHE